MNEKETKATVNYDIESSIEEIKGSKQFYKDLFGRIKNEWI